MLYMVTIGIEADSLEKAREVVHDWGVQDATLEKPEGLLSISGQPETWVPEQPEAEPA